ncbi:MAG: YihY/virulence factor BrkB family protein [Acidimicrobiia bacterium]|nr:YihY/virulence factor BrkB family protein [Acidimicrobiia bacterium]
MAIVAVRCATVGGVAGLMTIVRRAVAQVRDRAGSIAGRPEVAGRLDVARRFWVDAMEDRVTGLAAEIAFYATLSVFPAILAIAAMLGFVGSLVGEDAAATAQNAITDAMGQALGPGAINVQSAIESLFERPSPGLLGFGLAATIYTTSRGFNSMIRALDIVYDIVETRAGWRTRLLGLGLAAGSVVVAALVLTMLVVGPLLGSGQAVADWLGVGEAFATWWTWMRPPVLILALMTWASVMFHVAPNHQTPWRADLPGAVTTTVLWLLGAGGFRAYLSIASEGSNAVFGVLGGGLILMLWLYVMGLGLLIGGEVNSHIERGRRAPARSDPAT